MNIIKEFNTSIYYAIRPHKNIKRAFRALHGDLKNTEYEEYLRSKKNKKGKNG